MEKPAREKFYPTPYIFFEHYQVEYDEHNMSGINN